MRVISGLARGVRLNSPAEGTRPTSDRVKESLFSMIHANMEDAIVLDFFAGSGALGIEALSRGAQTCDFVENDRRALSVLKENVKKCRLEGACYHALDALKYLERCKKNYDVIFMDPPYARGGQDDLVALLLEGSMLREILDKEGLLIIEIPSELASPLWGKGSLIDRRDYGGSSLCFYR